MSTKKLSPPKSGGDLAAVLARRHAPASEPTAAEQTAAPAAAVPAPPAEPVVRVETAREQEMDRRSWYMPRSSADALTNAIADVHWKVRRPKHEVLAAVIEVALAHLDEVETKLQAAKDARK